MHYLYQTDCLEKIQVSKVDPNKLKDIIMFFATYGISDAYLQKITEDIVENVWNLESTYTEDKEFLKESLRFLLNLIPKTADYFKAYIQSKKYNIGSFITTVYMQ